MKTQQVLILASIGVVLAASAFVVVRGRRPPPPAPGDATLLLPGKALGPYSIGMTREAALSLRTSTKIRDTEIGVDEVGDGTFLVKARDGRVVSITTSSFGNGISVGGAWIQGAPAVDMARALSHTIGNCSEHFQPIEGMGGWSGPWFDCHGTKIEVDQGRGYLTIVVGQY